jgi:hypothetical protein
MIFENKLNVKYLYPNCIKMLISHYNAQMLQNNVTIPTLILTQSSNFTILLFVLLLKEGQDCAFDPSLGNFSFKSLLSCCVLEPNLEVG